MRFLTKGKNVHHQNLERFRQNKPRRWWRFLGLLVIAALLWYGVPLLIALNRVTTPNTTSSSSILKDVTNSENATTVNVLLLGIGGQSHPGGTLADSIMVASIDPKNNAISLLSVPRDLYVTIPGGGKQKINAAHSIGEQSPSNGGGPRLMKEVVSDSLGIPIHYFVRIDFDGFKKIVDTLGGVTVDVKTAIHDPFFPDAKLKGYEPFSISAGKHKLDGNTALKYVRSRETTSDFDRARRQQEVILAIRDKVFSTQTLANPKKVTDLISAVGKHLLTDFSASEIEDVIKLAKDLENPTINRKVLDNGQNGLLMSSRASNGASILIPKAGINDFSQIHVFVQGYFASASIQAEKPTIRIDRSGTTKETANKVAAQLEEIGFTVTQSEEAITPSTKTALYDYTDGKKNQSLTFLTTAYNVKEGKPKDQDATVNFVLVLGSDFTALLKSSPSTNANKKITDPSPLQRNNEESSIRKGANSVANDTAGIKQEDSFQ